MALDGGAGIDRLVDPFAEIDRLGELTVILDVGSQGFIPMLIIIDAQADDILTGMPDGGEQAALGKGNTGCGIHLRQQAGGIGTLELIDESGHVGGGKAQRGNGDNFACVGADQAHVFLILKGIRYQFHGFITRDFKFGKTSSTIIRDQHVFCKWAKVFLLEERLKCKKEKNSVNTCKIMLAILHRL